MEARLTKWGNSVAVRLPKAMLDRAKLQSGDVVELEAPAAGSILVRAKRKWPSLDERVASITPENRHSETDWGPPVGKEFW